MATARIATTKKPAAKAPPPKLAKHAAPPANGEATFDSLLDEAINSVPEEPELEADEYRFRVRAFTLNAARGRMVLTLQAVEALSGADYGDLSAFRPVFMTFDPTRAGDMRQLSDIAGRAGVDVASMSRREMIESKALVGVELVGSVALNEGKAGTANEGRLFRNVRGLRVPD